ncbi:acyltransferase, partial [Sphingobacterium sp.]|uniref:acyltransferase family protein n=1 Tax=Sphingobacterium sp. TaxID=341027 RepID=UPI00289FC035
MTKNPTISKPHYPILDGLRGVAAIIVVAYHLFEANAENVMYQYINHGYLAVDFFFLLSGFVISYAYDDRWSSMTTGNFFAKRIERLQPMVILGMLIGALLFYLGDSAFFPEIHNIPLWQVLAVMLIGFTLIPLPPQADIRQWDG